MKLEDLYKSKGWEEIPSDLDQPLSQFGWMPKRYIGGGIYEEYVDEEGRPVNENYPGRRYRKFSDTGVETMQPRILKQQPGFEMDGVQYQGIPAAQPAPAQPAPQPLTTVPSRPESMEASALNQSSPIDPYNEDGSMDLDSSLRRWVYPKYGGQTLDDIDVQKKRVNDQLQSSISEIQRNWHDDPYEMKQRIEAEQEAAREALSDLDDRGRDVRRDIERATQVVSRHNNNLSRNVRAREKRAREEADRIKNIERMQEDIWALQQSISKHDSKLAEAQEEWAFKVESGMLPEGARDQKSVHLLRQRSIDEQRLAAKMEKLRELAPELLAQQQQAQQPQASTNAPGRNPNLDSFFSNYGL